MYVCICNAVTDKMIRQAAESGVRTLAELSRQTGCATTCGSCAELAEEILHETRAAMAAKPFKLPLLAIPQAA